MYFAQYKYQIIIIIIIYYHILTNLNNAKIISQIPSSSNLLLKNRVFKLRGNQRFVYKSKMATKIRV